MTYVVLREPIFHPALISCPIMLLTGSFIRRMVVVVSWILLLGTGLREVFGSTLLLFRAVVGVPVEVTSLPKICFRVVRVVSVLNVDHSLILCLVNSLLGIDSWETYIFSFWVKSKQRDSPVPSLIVPL